MSRLINIAIRRNLIYVILSMAFYFLRKVDLIIINYRYNVNDSLLFTLLMLSGEFFAGISIFIYQNFNFKKDNIENKKYFGIELIQRKNKLNRRDSFPKILLLIFFTSYYDFLEFLLSSFYMPKYPVLSPTADSRFGGGIIILAAIICRYVLGIKILKHQYYSLIIIGICLIIITILEIIYRGIGASFSEFCFGYLIVLAYLVFVPITDVIEKYLMEFDFVNPFILLTLEAFFGFILVGIYSIGENPFRDIIRIYEKSTRGDFIFLIILLIAYFVLSAGSNTYRVLTNGLFSPMVKTLSVYILNPIIYIYYFIIGIDFISGGERNWFYFIANIIIALVISFFGCVFNEFLVLSFYGLDIETHFRISKRADDKMYSLDPLERIDSDPFYESKEESFTDSNLSIDKSK